MKEDVRVNIKELEEAISMHQNLLQKTRKYSKLYMIAAIIFIAFSVALLFIDGGVEAAMYSLFLAVFLAIVAGIYKNKSDKIKVILLEFDHQKNFEYSKLGIINEDKKKRLCKYCGTLLSEEEYRDKKCPKCGNSRFDY